jgi:UDP-N-acetylmuramoylalanine--D-glutamate ligase
MKRIVIIGSGESGTGAAVLAKQKGFEVFVTDKGPIKQKYKDVLSHHGIEWEEQQHTEKLVLNADEVIKSPGIPGTAPLIQQLRKQGTPVISEIEFAARYTNAKMICITGSNGKTTTATVTHHILEKAGLNVALGGNVGKSFAMLVAEGNYDYFVLELSSFQLDDMYEFRADIAILTNITPDHLDRYEYSLTNTASKNMRRRSFASRRTSARKTRSFSVSTTR